MTGPPRDDEARPGHIEVSGSGAAAADGGVAAGAYGTAIGGHAQVGAVNVGEQADPAKAIEPPYRPLPPEAKEQPNLLLRAAYGVVPIRGRAAHLDALMAWATDERRGRLALVTGPGGSGKTRLAAELAERLRLGGWTSGFLVSQPPELGLAGLVRSGTPVAVVIDDADSRQAQLLGLLDTLARERTGPWRVVALARAAGDWWESLAATARERPAEPALLGATRHELEPTEPTEPDRQAAFRAAADRFAAVLGIAASPPAPALADARFGRPLYLQLAALSAVFATRPDGPADVDPADLVRDALDRERAWWRRTASAAELRLDAGELDRAVAVASLADLAGEAEAADALRAVPGLAGDAEARRRVLTARWLHGCYPPDVAGGWLPSIGPDLLAEAHLAAVLEGDPSLAARALGGVTGTRAEKGLGLLARSARSHPAAGTALASLLADRPADLLLPAMTVALRVGDPIGAILADVLARDPDPALVDAVLDALPKRTVALRGLALVATGEALERARAAGDAGEFARLANIVGFRFGQLGRLEDALAASEESVATYRELAWERPGAFRADLALALSNLSNWLAVLGRQEEALAAIEEAVAIRRDLVARDPDAFGPDLATMLNNLSNRLGDLGRREEALAAIEEVVTSRRELAATQPDAFRPDLATALNNLSGQFRNLGRRDEALAAVEEAVAIRRELFARRPDAFAPELATSLNNLSGRLAELGRGEEALAAIEEAVAIRRELARQVPDVFAADLARSLVNLSSRLGDLGRSEEAEAAFMEAERLRAG